MKTLEPADVSIPAGPLPHEGFEFVDLHVVGAALVGPLAAISLWLLPLGLQPRVQTALAIILFQIIYWVAEPVDHAITALIGCYLFWALGVVKFSVAFSGFASTTPWFIFGGALIAEAVTKTGLAKQLAYKVLSATGTSYFRLLFGITTLSFIVTFLVPSGTARLTILASMLIGIVAVEDAGTSSNFAKGLFLVLAVTCNLFDKMILVGASSILAHGIIKEQTGLEVPWSQWLFAFLPAGVISIVACALTARWLYPARMTAPKGEQYIKQVLQKMGPMTAEQKKLLSILGVAIFLWATDALHHIDPTVICLGAGLFLALPKLGVLDTKSIKQVNFLIIIFAAGAMSMATVLAETKALAAVNRVLAEQIAPLISNGVIGSITLYWGGILYHFVFPNNQSLLSTSLPLLLDVTKQLGYNPVALGLIWQFAAGGTLFAYQSPVLLLGQSYGHFSGWDLLKLGTALMIIQGLLLMILVPFYWPLIGLGWFK